MMFPPCLPLVTGHHWSVVTVWAWSQHVSAGHRSSPETLVATMSYTRGQQPPLPHYTHRHQEEHMMFSDHCCTRGSHSIAAHHKLVPRPRPLSATGSLGTGGDDVLMDTRNRPALIVESLYLSVSIIKVETSYSRVCLQLPCIFAMGCLP